MLFLPKSTDHRILLFSFLTMPSNRISLHTIQIHVSHTPTSTSRSSVPNPWEPRTMDIARIIASSLTVSCPSSHHLLVVKPYSYEGVIVFNLGFTTQRLIDRHRALLALLLKVIGTQRRSRDVIVAGRQTRKGHLVASSLLKAESATQRRFGTLSTRAWQRIALG